MSRCASIAALATWVLYVGQTSPVAAQDTPPAANEASEADAGFPLMTGLLDEAVRNLARVRNEEGLRFLSKRNYPAALDMFKQAVDLDAEQAEYANNLGYIYSLLGNLDEAEKYLRKAVELDPERPAAYINLADLLGREGESQKRLAEAAQVLKKARELHGNKAKVILRQARTAQLLGDVQAAARHYREYQGAVKKIPDKVLLEIGDFFREIGRDDEAVAWYQKVSDAEELGKTAATRIWDIEVDRQAKQYGWSAQGEDVSEKARKMFEQVSGLIERKAVEEAIRLLEEIVASSPGYVEARVRLAELLQGTGKTAAAELELLRAAALDSGDAETFAALGDLYMGPKKDRRAAEAVLYYSRAVDLKPDWTELQWKFARALQAAGELDRALHHLELFLNQTPKGPARKKALRLKKAIAKVLGRSHRREIEQPESVSSGGLNKQLISALNRARAQLAKGRPDAAMAELRRLPAEQQGTLVMNLEAKILNVSGRPEEAAALLRKSLETDPIQAEVHEQLAQILSSLDDDTGARAHYEKAEALGNPSAVFQLAKLDAVKQGGFWTGWYHDLLDIRRLLSVKNRLDAFSKLGGSAMYAEEATALQVEITGRIRLAIGVVVGLLLLVVLLSAATARRVWGGVDIAVLLNRYPDAAPEVQRIFSAIRHEVLKHNTLALGGVIESIERGGPDAAEKALHFKRTLIGTKDDSVAMRLDKYAGELTKVARSLGLRLNLRRKEASVAMLYKGFGILRSVTPRLGSINRMSRTEKQRLLSALKKAFRLLNVDGYEAVQQVLGRIRMLEVDVALLRAVAVRVLREPAFLNVDVAPAAIEGDALPLSVMVSQRAFEDIIANLFRNALQSSIEMGLSPVEVGISAELEVDEVTGYERAVFQVSDRAKKELTTEMIRGRAIEGGLGLTVDLAARYDGTVDVVPGRKGWVKAIRVKLPATPENMEIGRET